MSAIGLPRDADRCMTPVIPMIEVQRIAILTLGDKMHVELIEENIAVRIQSNLEKINAQRTLIYFYG